MSEIIEEVRQQESEEVGQEDVSTAQDNSPITVELEVQAESQPKDEAEAQQEPKIEGGEDEVKTCDKEVENGTDKENEDKESPVEVLGATAPETQEVSSTRDDEQRPKQMRSSRRQSYNSSRGYAGGYQNYGLTYLPYKSNFEPSEDARRRADEFFKSLKL